MDTTTFINPENSNISKSHVLKLADKLDLRRGGKKEVLLYQILVNSSYNNNKFKISVTME